MRFQTHNTNTNTSFDVVNVVIAVAMDIAKLNRVQQVSLLVNNPAVILCSNKMKRRTRERSSPEISLRAEWKSIQLGVCV